MTEGYRADRETVIKILNESLATEIVCVLRYKRHYFMVAPSRRQCPQFAAGAMGSECASPVNEIVGTRPRC